MTPFPLRPMGLGDILDAAFRIYRERFRICFLLGLFPSVTLLSLVPIQLFLTRHLRGVPFLDILTSILIFLSIISLLALILSSLTIAATTHLVSEQFFGRVLRFSHLLPVIRHCLARIILATLIFAGALVLVPGALFALGIGAFSWALQQPVLLSAQPIAALVFCAVTLSVGVLLTVYIVLSFLLISQVLVIEDLPTLAAIARSRRLIMTRTLPGFFNHPVQRAGMLLVMVFVIQSVISGIGQVPSEAVAFFVLRNPQISALGYALVLVTTLFHVVVNALVTPLSTIVLVLFYYDLRIRGEGLDLELTARRLRAAAPPPPTPQPLVAGREERAGLV